MRVSRASRKGQPCVGPDTRKVRYFILHETGKTPFREHLPSEFSSEEAEKPKCRWSRLITRWGNPIIPGRHRALSLSELCPLYL